MYVQDVREDVQGRPWDVLSLWLPENGLKKVFRGTSPTQKLFYLMRPTKRCMYKMSPRTSVGRLFIVTAWKLHKKACLRDVSNTKVVTLEEVSTLGYMSDKPIQYSIQRKKLMRNLILKLQCPNFFLEISKCTLKKMTKSKLHLANLNV